jgi:hypothetical protein
MPPMNHASSARMNPRQRLLALAGCMMLLLQFPATPTFANPTPVSGKVYYDNDGSGQQEVSGTRQESGAPGVRVDVYGTGDSPIATTTTARDGTYSLSVPVPAGTEVRVEFDVPRDGLQSGPFGAAQSSSTTVTFVRRRSRM